MKKYKQITIEKFEAVKNRCPVICGVPCEYNNCVLIFGFNVLAKELEK